MVKLFIQMRILKKGAKYQDIAQMGLDSYKQSWRTIASRRQGAEQETGQCELSSRRRGMEERAGRSLSVPSVY